MIPFAQLSEALARWRTQRRAAESGSNGAPPADEQGEVRDAEIEPEEIIEPEPE